MVFVLIVDFAELEVDQGSCVLGKHSNPESPTPLCLCLVDCGSVLFVCFMEKGWVLFCFETMPPDITQAGLEFTVKSRMTLNS